MSDHLNSYLKSIFFAIVAMLVCLALGVVWLVFGDGIRHPQFLLDITELPIILMAVLCGLIALGGIISIKRDSLEVRGKPYFTLRPRERPAGQFIRARRRLLNLLPGSPNKLRLRPGEFVYVRPLAEITAALDGEGRFEGLPFMPEMARFCGQRHRVFRRVERIHNYYDPEGPHMRTLQDAVLLDQLRCSGDFHGGCQAACQIIWKEAWLAPANHAQADAAPVAAASDATDFAKLVRECSAKEPDGETRYACQMTLLPSATTRTRANDPRHYLRDLWSGNVRFDVFLTAVALNLFNFMQRRTGGEMAPYRMHDVPKVHPSAPLNLQPGERVRVKSKTQIEGTLVNSKNRGLWFDVEMHRFCGGEFRVATRVSTIVSEATGRLLSLKNPCIVLEGVSATGEYLALCPQNELIYWREAWLERVDVAPDQTTTQAVAAVAVPEESRAAPATAA